MQALKIFLLKDKIASGQRAALWKQFRLMGEKKEELQEYVGKEDDPGIKGILKRLITEIEHLASLDKELK